MSRATFEDYVVDSFGVVHGREVSRYTFVGDGGIMLRVIDLGAAVQELWVPVATNSTANVVLGCADAQGYAATPNHYFGAVVGRFANRIDQGRFTLDGVVHELSRNDGSHSLHGGTYGFHLRHWTVTAVNGSGITMELLSPDGDQGFPGELRVSVDYRLVGSTVSMRYRAQCQAPTVVNLTNHAHFNLGGEGSGSIDHHLLRLNAQQYSPVRPDLIPTGELVDVEGTPFDFRTPKIISHGLSTLHPQLRHARGYDHNFALAASTNQPAAVLCDPRSGRTLTVRTDQPGLQLYTGNFFDGSQVGSSGSSYRQGAGVALETQHFPDSPNQPGFRSTVLRPGETFRTWTSWTFAPVTF